MKYTIFVTNIMDKKYFVGNIYVCNNEIQFYELYNGILKLFNNIGYVVENELTKDNEDIIAYIRIERTPTNGNNDTNY